MVLVTSDCHAGLRDAIAQVLPGASWQRCRARYIRYLLTRVPKSAHLAAATLVRTIFDQPDQPAVREQHARVIKQHAERFPRAAKLLDEAREDHAGL